VFTFRMLAALPRLLLLCSLSVAAVAAEAPLDLLRRGLGGERFRAIEAFSYRLTITELPGDRVVRDARYRLEAATGRLETTDLATGERRLWDGKAGWRITTTGREPLSDAATAALRNQVAYHFVRLLHDPATAIAALAPERYRLTPADAAPFDVVVDPVTGRILENHFGADLVGHELDYQVVDGVAWPMVFEVHDAGVVTRRGRFSEAAFAFRAGQPAAP
jgi:hypothetical protein